MLHDQQGNSVDPFSIVMHHHHHTSSDGGGGNGNKRWSNLWKSSIKWIVVTFLLVSMAVVILLSSSYSAAVPFQTRWLNCPVCPQTTPEAAIASQNHQQPDHPSTTNISHIVFGIGGSVATWSNRKRYTELWWKPNHTRGFVWLEDHPKPPESEHHQPPYRVSEYRGGGAAANRISRIVLESYRVGLERVRWFVMGDDDTVFFPDNLVTVLSRYDHNEMYYIGGNSESVEQNVMHSYGMAFGGGGFAISYALAAQLDKVLDACIRRYSYFYGSDERIEACLAEIGVPLTPNRGFHQNDVRGNLYGLLAAHPLTPLVSLHHLEAVTPIFPNNTQLDSLKLLFSAYNVDPGRILQQSFCHDFERNWSISVSWGYTVQLYPSLLTAKVLQTALLTFKTWRSWSNAPFTFNTRQISSDPCEHPLVYFLDQVSELDNDEYMTSYKRFVGETGLDCERALLAVHRVNVRTTRMMLNDWKDEHSRTNNKELDRAISLSLADDSRMPNGHRRAAGNDDLARAHQESLNMSSCPPYASSQNFSRGYRLCGGCKCEIGSGNYLGCMGAFWHPQCFRCHACYHPITEHEFSLSGKNPYHKSCFKEMYHPKCEVCHHFIPTNGAGLIEYRSHPFWSQKYCPSHENDRTARCCSCERLESWNSRYVSLEDGRSLCFECMESAIMDTGDCQSLYHAIRDYYEGMNMKLDQQIPMLLVERQALNEAIEGEKNGYHHMPETRGLCLSEEQTVSIIHKRPRIGGNRLIGMRTQPQKLTRRCEVTAILVLYGLPRLLTGSILAHELMHGWLRLNGYRNLTPEVEEGICQVLSYMWLESEVMPGSTSLPSTSTASSTFSSSKKGKKSDVEKKLGGFFMHVIAHDTSTAYGEGFRAANAAVNRYGLRRTLDHIRLTGNFPL